MLVWQRRNTHYTKLCKVCNKGSHYLIHLHRADIFNVVTKIINKDCLTPTWDLKRLLFKLTLNVSSHNEDNKTGLYPVPVNIGAYWHFKYPQILETSMQICRICIWQRICAFPKQQLEDRWIPWGIWNGIRCPCLGNLSCLPQGRFWLFMYECTK